MTPLTLELTGELYQKKETMALLLHPAGERLNLRFALVTKGVREHIFPALLLDDWGNEHSTLAIYEWILTQGERFPRAEVFGYEQTGEDTQVFLRALEIYDKLPLYVYPVGVVGHTSTAIARGLPIKHVFLPHIDLAGRPVASDVPPDLPAPLSRADVRWWQVNPNSLATYAFISFSIKNDHGSA